MTTLLAEKDCRTCSLNPLWMVVAFLALFAGFTQYSIVKNTSEVNAEVSKQQEMIRTLEKNFEEQAKFNHRIDQKIENLETLVIGLYKVLDKDSSQALSRRVAE